MEADRSHFTFHAYTDPEQEYGLLHSERTQIVDQHYVTTYAWSIPKFTKMIFHCGTISCLSPTEQISCRHNQSTKNGPFFGNRQKSTHQMMNLYVVILFTDKALFAVQDKIRIRPFLREDTSAPIGNLLEMLTFCIQKILSCSLQCKERDNLLTTSGQIHR